MSGNTLRENTVVLRLVFHCPVMAATEITKRVDTDGNQRWFSINKRLLTSAAYKELCDEAYSTTNWVAKRQVPGDLQLAASYHAIPVASVAEVDSYVNESELRYMDAVSRFLAEYEECKERARDELKDSYREADYRPTTQLQRCFWVEKKWIELGVPSESKLGTFISEIERAKVARQWEEDAAAVTMALRSGLADLVGGLAERLKPAPDGTKRRLHESALTSTLEWLELFNNRNVLNDTECEVLVTKARRLLQGKSVELLRENDFFRGRLANQMDEIKQAVDKLITDAPGRRIVLED